MYQALNDLPRPRTILLKGEPGTGKTYKAAQFPKPVFFNFDNNLAGLAKLPKALRDNIRVVNPFVDDAGKDVADTVIWTNFVRQLGKVVADDSVRTVIIDSLTTLASRLMDQIIGSSQPTAKVQIQHWGDFARYLKWFGDEFLCDPKLDKNVIMIAHEQIERDELTQSIRYTLNIGGSMRTSLDLYFSDVWRCYVNQPQQGEPEYKVRVLPANQFNAKNTLENIPKEFIWDAMSAKIFDQIK